MGKRSTRRLWRLTLELRRVSYMEIGDENNRQHKGTEARESISYMKAFNFLRMLGEVKSK